MTGLERLLQMLKIRAGDAWMSAFNQESFAPADGSMAGMHPPWDDAYKEWKERSMWDYINSKPQFRQNVNGYHPYPPRQMNGPSPYQMPGVTGPRG